MKNAIIVLAAVLIAIGSVVVLVDVIGVLDPVGTKAADDSDPFGPLAPRSEAVVIAGFVCRVRYSSCAVGVGDRNPRAGESAT